MIPESTPVDLSSGALLALLEAEPGVGLVAYDAAGRIAYFNRGAERLFGYRAANLTGAATYEVLHRPEDFVRFFNAGFLSDPRPWTLELECRTRSGEWLPTRVTLSPVARGGDDAPVWLALYRDNSEGVRASGQLEELRRLVARQNSHSEKEADFLRALLGATMEIIQIGLVVHEVETGMIAYVNDGFSATTGLDQLMITGSTWDVALADHPEACAHLTGFLDEVRAVARAGGAPPTPRHWEVALPSGTKVVEVYGRPLHVEGHPANYVLLVLEDHTERHRLQMQLVQSEKLAAIGQLAAGIAHELRNPLSTIFHALYDLNELMQPRPPGAEEDIEICMHEIKRVQDIITNLLDFAREGERSGGQADLNEVLGMTIRLVRHDLASKSIATDLHAPGDLPPVAINGNALKQILINLITNAVQAMEQGGHLVVEASLRHGPVPTGMTPNDPPGTGTSHRDNTTRIVKLAAPSIGGDAPDDVHVSFSVTDTGTGIPAHALAHVFNPFFTTKEPGQGTGLGLSVVHALVMDARGAITVETAPGRGTRITVELPIVREG